MFEVRCLIIHLVDMRNPSNWPRKRKPSARHFSPYQTSAVRVGGTNVDCSAPRLPMVGLGVSIRVDDRWYLKSAIAVPWFRSCASRGVPRHLLCILLFQCQTSKIICRVKCPNASCEFTSRKPWIGCGEMWRRIRLYPVPTPDRVGVGCLPTRGVQDLNATIR